MRVLHWLWKSGRLDHRGWQSINHLLLSDSLLSRLSGPIKSGVKGLLLLLRGLLDDILHFRGCGSLEFGSEFSKGEILLRYSLEGELILLTYWVRF